MSGSVEGVAAAGPLPFTGGIFTVPIMLLGLLLTLSAFVLGTIRKVRESRS